jgi:hypothetical protein
MANSENDIIKAAMRATDREIFGEAFGNDEPVLDETGDRSLEEMGTGLEGQIEPDEDEEPEAEVTGEEAEAAEVEAKEGDEGKKAEEAESAAKAEAETKANEPKGRVPAGRLREETKRAQAAEAALAEAKGKIAEAEVARKKDIDTLTARFDGVLAALNKQQQAAPPQKADADKPAGPPDLFEDPKAFADYVANAPKAQIEQMRSQMDQQRVEFSLNLAHQKHGDAFTKAFETVTKLDPYVQENKELVQRMWKSPNPGEALVQWHKRNEALREVGDDPSAYKAKIAEETRKSLASDPEFRKQLLESLRDEAATGDEGRPRNLTRLPASLNRASGGNHLRSDGADRDDSNAAIFDSVFKSA